MTNIQPKEGEKWIEKDSKRFFKPTTIMRIDTDNDVIYIMIRNDDEMCNNYERGISISRFLERYKPFIRRSENG